MDPLTHTLFGAAAATTRPAERTPLAAAALVLGANAPDVDAFLYFVDGDLALLLRRGWTHGLAAMAVWPVVLLALLLLYRRLRGGPRPEPLRLLAFACVGVWSHPCLDWLNTYGLRWLSPFDGTWFYGDAVFIADPWLWLILGCGFLLPRRPRPFTMISTFVAAALLATWVGRRAPDYLPLVLLVAVAVLAALLVTPRSGRARIAAAALALAVLYIGGRIGLQALTERRVEQALEELAIVPERMMVGPVPVRLLTWDVLVESAGVYRYGRYTWGRPGLDLAERAIPSPAAPRVSAEDRAHYDAWRTAQKDPTVAGLVGWMRFPWYEVEETPDGLRVHLLDARYARSRSSGFGAAVVELGGKARAR